MRNISQDSKTRQNSDARISHLGAIPVDRLVVWITAFVVITSLVGLLATLAGVFHALQVLLVSLLLTGLYGYGTHVYGASLPGCAPRWRHIFLLLLVALIFRLPVYHYVLGGQDEGVYVNIAHYIEDTGGIKVHDKVIQQLEGTPYLQQYIAENSVGTSYLLGVYKNGYENSGRLEFQFYDVFPIWMALFCGVFGSMAGVYALTFLALLSIVLFYRIALLLTGSYNAALTAGGLLALSPLHAFFSKFPVTEVPALCLALIGFLLLAAYWSAPEDRRQHHWLVLSVLAFLCVFTTRISGFMYIPFFIALGWASWILDPDRRRCRSLQWWAIGTTIAYLASVLYGFIWSYPYAHDIYSESFAPLFGAHWKIVLLAVSAAVIALWVCVMLSGRQETLRGSLCRGLVGPCEWLPGAVIWAALLLGLIKIYRLGWTAYYSSDPSLDARWHLTDAGWQSAAASSLWTLIVFMGPFLVLAFLILSIHKKTDPRWVFLHWFVAGFFAYVMLLQWVIPYSPYYARYLLSELVPYTILFVVCVWSSMQASRKRRVLSLSISLSLVYAAGLSAAQVGKNENEGAYDVLTRVVAPVGPSDLILLDHFSFNQSAVKTPLLYTFHREAVTVTGAQLENSGYMGKLDSLYGNVFLLTKQPYAPSGFDPVKSVRFKVMQYEWSHSFPRKLVTMMDVPLTLYRIAHITLPANEPISFAVGGTGLKWLRSGWSHPEAWGVWSLGDQAVMSIDPRDLPKTNDRLSLLVHANVLVSEKHRVQRIVVTVDGKEVGRYVVNYPLTRLSMKIPLGSATTTSTRRRTVKFTLPDAVTPQALGLNGDSRDLALGLVDAQIQLTQSAAASKPVPAISSR